MLYEPLSVERLRALYRIADVRPTVQDYQVLNSRGELIGADPIGLLMFARYGWPMPTFEDDNNMLGEHEYTALFLSVPLEYIVGFNFAYEGRDPLEETAGMDIDPDDPNFADGVRDGERARAAFVDGPPPPPIEFDPDITEKR